MRQEWRWARRGGGRRRKERGGSKGEVRAKRGVGCGVWGVGWLARGHALRWLGSGVGEVGRSNGCLLGEMLSD